VEGIKEDESEEENPGKERSKEERTKFTVKDFCDVVRKLSVRRDGVCQYFSTGRQFGTIVLAFE
jgi:hypothetical protein